MHIDFIVEAAAPADGGGGGGGGGDATNQRAALESLRGAVECLPGVEEMLHLTPTLYNLKIAEVIVHLRFPSHPSKTPSRYSKTLSKHNHDDAQRTLSRHKTFIKYLTMPQGSVGIDFATNAWDPCWDL